MTDNVCNTVNCARRRNFGVDLLRIVAMLMVCVIHVNYFLGAQYTLIPGKEGFHYFAIWIESVGIIGVNLYAIITGYVCIDSPWKFARYFRLWVLVLFYTIGLFTLNHVLFYANLIPLYTGPIGWAYLLKKMFFGSTYWYFAAYTGLFFVMPFLNRALRAASRAQCYCLMLVLVFLFPVINVGGGIIFRNGHNMTWLCALYVAGACLKLYPVQQLRSSWLLLVALLSTLLPLLFCCAGLNIVWDYAWPGWVLYSIALFIVFSRVNIPSVRCQRLISLAAPATFSVYIIHAHPFMWNMLREYFCYLCKSWDFPLWIAVAGGCIIYMLCTLIDRVRMFFFRMCRVDVMSDTVASLIQCFVTFVLKRIKVM